MPKKPSELADSDLGLSLIILRAIRGFTQQELGALAGVRPPSLSDYELGKMVPSLRTLKLLLAAMDLPLSALEETEQFVDRIRRRSLSQSSRQGTDAEDVSAEIGRVAGLFARTLFGLAGGGGKESLEPDAEVQSLPSPEEESQVAGLWQRLKSLAPAARLALVNRDASVRNAALARFLSRETIVVAGSDPKRAVTLGELAVAIARQLEAPSAFKSRLLGYSLAHLANAQHASGSVAKADRAFAESDGHWTPWSADEPDSLDDAVVFAMKASLRRAQGRFTEAISLNDSALSSRGSEEIRCQLLISKGNTLSESGDLTGAVAALQEAAAEVTGTEDLRVMLALRQTLADALSKAGHFAEAKELLPEVKRLAARAGRDLDFARVQWVEGRVAAGLGETEAAVSLLQQSRGAFMSKGIALDAALVTLELVFLYVEDGRMASVKDVARNLASLFKAQALPRETLVALQLFRQAAEAEKVTTDLVERLLSYLRRSRYDPDLRFEQ